MKTPLKRVRPRCSFRDCTTYVPPGHDLCPTHVLRVEADNRVADLRRRIIEHREARLARGVK